MTVYVIPADAGIKRSPSFVDIHLYSAVLIMSAWQSHLNYVKNSTT